MNNRITQCKDGEDCDKPYYELDYSSNEEGVYGVLIEKFVVPSHQRGSGLGTKLYEEFERNLPENIKVVGLIAADLGSGPTQDFWKRQGFVPAFDYDSVSKSEVESMFYCMVKGVNGQPNPDPLPISEYDEPYWPAAPTDKTKASTPARFRP